MSTNRTKRQLEYLSEKLKDPVFTARLELSLWYKNAQRNIGAAKGAVTGAVLPINLMLVHLMVVAEHNSELTGISVEDLVSDYKDGLDQIMEHGLDCATIGHPEAKEDTYSGEGIEFELDDLDKDKLN